MTRRKFAKWYCAGCGKHHDHRRDIEGETAPGEYWCAHAMKQAIKKRWNYRPPEHQLRQFAA